MIAIGQALRKLKKQHIVLGSILLVGLAIAVAGGLGYANDRKAAVAEYLELGNQYLTDLNYEDALAVFERAISIEPKSKDAYMGLAAVYEGSGRYEQAEAAYLVVTNMYPGDGEAYEALAELYIREDKPEKARDLLEAAIGRTDSKEVAELYESANPKPPYFSLQPGSYDDWQAVEILTNSKDEIVYYTTDGSMPDENGMIYHDFLLLTGGTTEIRCKVINSRGFESETVDAEYTILREKREITLKDPYMERIVRSTLGQWYDELYDEDAAQIRSLTLAGPYEQYDSSYIMFMENGYLLYQNISAETGNLTTLEDLQYMPFLQELQIAYQEQLSLNGIEQLRCLKSLSLIHNDLESLDGIQNLVTLERLCANQNRISDLEPIAGLQGLRMLSLWDNRVSDLTAVGKLTELNYLDLSDNNITDLSPLQNLKKIRELWLYGNRIADLSPLLELEQLRVLMLRDNPLEDHTVLLKLYPRLSRTDIMVKMQGGGV